MSQFIEALRSKKTGKVMPSYAPLSLTVKELNTDVFRTTDEYEFRVEWVVKAHCDSSHFEPLLKNVINQLRDAVYGEFRDNVLRLERAIYEQDIERAFMELREILRIVRE